MHGTGAWGSIPNSRKQYQSSETQSTALPHRFLDIHPAPLSPSWPLGTSLAQHPAQAPQ